MKQAILFSIFIISVFVLGSCGKDSYAGKSTSERVVGTWTFDKVKYDEAGKSKVDVTDQFHNSSFIFRADSSCVYYDHSTGRITNGVWELYSYEVYNNSNQDTDKKHDLYIFLEDSTSLIGYQTRILKTMEVHRHRMTAQEDDFSGTYDYKFCRVEQK